MEMSINFIKTKDSKTTNLVNRYYSNIIKREMMNSNMNNDNRINSSYNTEEKRRTSIKKH